MDGSTRAVPLSRVAAGLEALRIARSRQVHMFAHEVGNSLLAAKLNAEALSAKNDGPPLRDLVEAVAEIGRLVTELKRAVDSELGLIELDAEPVVGGVALDPLVFHEIVRELSAGTPPRLDDDADEVRLVFPPLQTSAQRRRYARAARLLESIGGALEVRPAAVIVRIKKLSTAE